MKVDLVTHKRFKAFASAHTEVNPNPPHPDLISEGRWRIAPALGRLPFKNALTKGLPEITGIDVYISSIDEDIPDLRGQGIDFYTGDVADGENESLGTLYRGPDWQFSYLDGTMDRETMVGEKDVNALLDAFATMERTESGRLVAVSLGGIAVASIEPRYFVDA